MKKLIFLFFIIISNKVNAIDKLNRQDTILLISMNLKDTFLIKNVADKVSSFCNIPVKCINNNLPSAAYIPSVNRYNANKLIECIATSKHYKFIIGLTDVDICTKKDNNPHWGIFGLGAVNNTGCIISTFRMKKNTSYSNLIVRTQKVVLHEIGHNSGLQHCNSEYPCFMKDANGTIKQVDNEPLEMCKICKNKIE